MIKNKYINLIVDNLKTLLYALVIAVLLRSLFYQPFYIPSSSMEPTLLVVIDYLYQNIPTDSKHSFPFSPPIYNKRIFSKEPVRGDLVVFKTPADNRTDYIKRLIGLPGDRIQFVNGDILFYKNKIPRRELNEKLLKMWK